jgi:DNA-binding transcriptional ArsR family regulator
MTMVIDDAILRQVGICPAVIHAVLVANGGDEWTAMSYREIAEAVGLSERTVQRHMQTLKRAKLLKSQPFFIGNTRQPNAYQTLSPVVSG